MAVNVNAQNVSFARGEVIDLTGIDDDENEDENYPIVSDRFRSQKPSQSSLTNKRYPLNVANGHHSEPSSNTISTTSTPNGNLGLKRSESRLLSIPPSQHVRPSQTLPSPSPYFAQASDQPSKRRKLQHDASREAASPMTDTKTLTKCLQSQVFPHLERAVQKLDKNVFNVEKLGGKIIANIADKDFERHFYEGNGRLTPDVEASVIARIHKCLEELIPNDEFRHRPAPPQLAPKPVPKPTVQPPVSVLPSIEDPPKESISRVLNGDDENDGDGLEKYFQGGVDFSHEVSQQQIETPPRARPKKKPLVTPQQTRSKAKATLWQSGKSYEFKREGSPLQVKSRWFGLSSKPYLPTDVRHQIARGVDTGRLLRMGPEELCQPSVYHVDFSDEEVTYVRLAARLLYGRLPVQTQRSNLQDLRHLMRKSKDIRSRIVDAHRRGYTRFKKPPPSLLKRSADDLQNFLDDVLGRQVHEERKLLFLERNDSTTQGDASRTNVVPSLLLAREIVGNRLGATRRYQNFTTTFRNNREDHIEPKVEWTNCAGDIMTITWNPDSTRFVCGTTTHSDSHNQQYNKPGNLLFGSVAKNALQAYPDHRIPRPLIEHGDNALPSMRESQDPWLYTSVVSSDYDPATGWIFTSSFDHTVKAWCPTETNLNGMDLRDTWKHEGRVNFVVTNKCGRASKVATAADVPTSAVRVYHPVWDDEGFLHYKKDDFSCKRVHGEDYVPSDKWAYFPSAARWGIESSVNHLLLIGYSPRSLNNDDNEIPEDKRDTGELCLWDTNTNTEVKVNSAATANVFEVAWHPTRPTFAAATSASQTSEKIEEHIRTQIRIFNLNKTTGQYGVVKTLGCPAIDINEIAIRPNSTLYSYVAAGCTDGKVYVWDQARRDEVDPMCVLEHGDPVEEIIGDREHEDVGVKFMAWATTTDRLYTGSSDGVVKVWNMRHGKEVLVRDLIEVAAPITAGAFSPDFTRLLIGDGSGRVYLMDMEGDELGDAQNNPAANSSSFLQMQLQGRQRAIRRPRPFIPHPTPPPPDLGEDQPMQELQAQTGQEIAKAYLNASQLIIRPDPTIGAVQGPAYADTKLYRAEAHLDGDVRAPLLSAFESLQRANQSFSQRTRLRRQKKAKTKPSTEEQEAHWENKIQDFYMDLETRSKLRDEGAEVDFSPFDLDYEED
ncbi:WD40 repeat-like protein [Jackrogersella minutella]|nr:WD40 repeat-like protein [Jackrogersella minutella]